MRDGLWIEGDTDFKDKQEMAKVMSEKKFMIFNNAIVNVKDIQIVEELQK